MQAGKPTQATQPMIYPAPYAAALGRAGQITQQSSIVVGGQEPLTTEMLSQAPPQVTNFVSFWGVNVEFTGFVAPVYGYLFMSFGIRFCSRSFLNTLGTLVVFSNILSFMISRQHQCGFSGAKTNVGRTDLPAD